MAHIIPFENASKLPEYIKAFNVTDFNSDLTVHAGGGFPVISIKGKTFAVVRDGERKVIPNPKDPESPATSIEVVIIKANKNTSKVYYAKGYDKDTSEGQKPDCYSNDGIAPAADAQNPQSKKCATCPHNQWGSRITEKGTTKGKACADVVRLAVAPVGQLNDPMLLRVPPASIRALGEYGQLLTKRGVSYNMVVTKISFDTEAESPRLLFKPVGFLDESEFAQVRRMMEADIVYDILGISRSIVDDVKITETVKTDTTAVESADKVETTSKETSEKSTEKPTTKKEEAVVVDDDTDIDLDLDGISFDD